MARRGNPLGTTLLRAVVTRVGRGIPQGEALHGHRTYDHMINS